MGEKIPLKSNDLEKMFNEVEVIGQAATRDKILIRKFLVT